MAQQLDAGVGDGGLEVAAEVVLVCEQDLPWSGGGQGGVIVEQVEQDLAFVGLGAVSASPMGSPCKVAIMHSPQK